MDTVSKLDMHMYQEATGQKSFEGSPIQDLLPGFLGEVGRMQSRHKTWETDHSRHSLATAEQGDLLQ